VGLHGLAGTRQPRWPVPEHVPSAPTGPHTVKITCGSKTPADKTEESKGPLAGDQAWLPLQKPRQGQGVGYAAGRWEQALCPVQGSSQGARKGPAFDPGGRISDVGDRSSGRAGEPGEQLPGSWGRGSGQAGGQQRGWPALWALPQGRWPVDSQWPCSSGVGGRQLCEHPLARLAAASHRGQGPEVGEVPLAPRLSSFPTPGTSPHCRGALGQRHVRVPIFRHEPSSKYSRLAWAAHGCRACGGYAPARDSAWGHSLKVTPVMLAQRQRQA